MRTLPQLTTVRNLHPLAQLPTLSTPPAPQLAEAPCSINGHLTVGGLTVQVTGRGFTGEEAAANFHSTVAALQPAPAPQPEPPSRDAQLGTLLTCWLGKAAARQDFGLVERLSKGAALVLANMVELSNGEGVLAVRSAQSPETWYEVTTGTTRSCTCQDYACHVRKGQPEHACKHICAAALWLKLV